jgi:hypothetical protein
MLYFLLVDVFTIQKGLTPIPQVTIRIQQKKNIQEKGIDFQQFGKDTHTAEMVLSILLCHGIA